MPEPTVNWYSGNQLIEHARSSTQEPHVIVNKLEITGVTRESYNSSFKCRASNTKLVPPIEQTVRLDMLCKFFTLDRYKTVHNLNIIDLSTVRPTAINITDKRPKYIADKEYTLLCEVKGSIPDTDIQWMQNSRRFERGKVRMNEF